MNQYKLILILWIFLISALNIQQDRSRQSTNLSLAITFPSPVSVQLLPGGRFYDRYQGNINYIKYQHEYYAKEMLEAFTSRHYSPGKLLERMWDGEYAGKWLDAATRTAVNTNDGEMLEMVDKFAKSLHQYQQPNGYLGIELPTNRKLNEWEKEWDNWNQWTSMIGFLTHYELRGEKASLEVASGIGKWIITTFGPLKEKDNKFIKGTITNAMTRVVIIGQLMRLYKYTGNPDLIDFVQEVIEQYPPIIRMLKTGEPYLFHPYMLGAVLMGMADYASITEDTKMLSKIEQIWQKLANTHMFPTGSLGERENLDDKPVKDVPDGQLQETCATTEWIFLTMKLYELTGHVKYINALEKTCYNALIGAQSDDGMKWCYWTPLRYSKHFLHGPTRCCFWSGPRGIARIPQLMCSTKKDSICINFFESSSALLSTAGGYVKVIQDSKFPEKGSSSITIETLPVWQGAVKVRVPPWVRNFKATLNSLTVNVDQVHDGYLQINLQGSQKYKVDISFDMPLELDELDGNYVIRRGPEVLAIDTRDNIDTWLGARDDLITLPHGMTFLPLEPGKRYQWAGPVSATRRRYLVKVNDARTDELRSVVLTPYADAGNEGAAFRTAFPKEKK